MDIKEYSYILAVVDTGSISEAAKNLYISQPSLSMYIKNLEERLGFKFFHKSEGKLYMTDLGKTYIQYARQIIALDASLHKALESTRNLESGQVIMGVTATRATMLLPMVLPVFKENYPNIDIQIIEATSVQLEEMAHNRKIDFAIINQPQQPVSLETVPICKEEIVVAVPNNSPIVHYAQVKLDCPYEWIEWNP